MKRRIHRVLRRLLRQGPRLTYVVWCSVPFEPDELGVVAARIAATVEADGGQTALVNIPVPPDGDAGELVRLLDLEDACDRLIAVGATAALLEHPDKQVVC